jgi:hypothetical protein
MARKLLLQGSEQPSEKINGDRRLAGFAERVLLAEGVVLDKTRSVAQTRSVVIPLNSPRVHCGNA